MRFILFLAMVCLLMAVLLETANAKPAGKKDNKKGAVAVAKGKASPKAGKSQAGKGKGAKGDKKDAKLKAKKDKKAKPAKKGKAAKAVKGAPKTVKKLASAKIASAIGKKSPAKPMVTKAAVPPPAAHSLNQHAAPVTVHTLSPHQAMAEPAAAVQQPMHLHQLNGPSAAPASVHALSPHHHSLAESTPVVQPMHLHGLNRSSAGVPPPNHAHSLMAVPSNREQMAAERAAYTSAGTDGQQNDYYGAEDSSYESSRDFDAMSEDELLDDDDDEDSLMSGETDNYGNGIGKDYRQQTTNYGAGIGHESRHQVNDYGRGTGQEYGQLPVGMPPPKSVMLD